MGCRIPERVDPVILETRILGKALLNREIKYGKFY